MARSPPPKPSSFAQRLANATVGKKNQQPPNPTQPPPDRPTPQPKPQPQAKPKRTYPANRRKAVPKEKSTDRSSLLGADFALPQGFDEAATALFSRDATDRELFEIIKPFCGQILASVLRGATGRSMNAVADRQTLFRMLGTGWAKGNIANGKATEDRDLVLAARLGAALGRVEGTSRHKSVTVDAEIAREPAPDGASSEVERQLSDLTSVRRALLAGRSAALADEDDESLPPDRVQGWAGGGQVVGRSIGAALTDDARRPPSLRTDLAMGGGGVSSFTPRSNSPLETGLGPYEFLRSLVPEIAGDAPTEKFSASEIGALEFE